MGYYNAINSKEEDAICFGQPMLSIHIIFIGIGGLLLRTLNKKNLDLLCASEDAYARF